MAHARAHVAVKLSRVRKACDICRMRKVKVRIGSTQRTYSTYADARSVTACRRANRAGVSAPSAHSSMCRATGAP